MRKEEQLRRQRRYAYRQYMVIALCLIAGRIVSVTSIEGDTAFQSANDRSRWCTVASLVEDGTYEIDRVRDIVIRRKGKRDHLAWRSLDQVYHRGSDGQLHYYSSKPPLFPTLVAGVYKAVHVLTGLTMTQNPLYVPRLVLLMVNLPLVFLFFWCTIWSVDRVMAGEWSRRFAAAATCFGTMLTPFAISLNNHLPAAAATALVVYLYLHIAEQLDADVKGESTTVPRGLWVLAGLAAGFTAANELPALSMMCLWVVLFFLLDRQGVVPFCGGIALVAIAFFGTNWLAHGSLRPPYMHRGNGAEIATVSLGEQAGKLPSVESIRQSLIQQNAVRNEQTVSVEESGEENRWVVTSDENVRFALLSSQAAGSPTWQLTHWDDWYDYPGSYWSQNKQQGVDEGEKSRLVYLFNMTLGHHGLFSLTPLWVLVPFGFYLGLAFGPKDFQRLVLAALIASAVCFLFYLFRPLIDRNYGGKSCCFRWMLWFAPMWMVVMAPVIEGFSDDRRYRIGMLALLGLSVISVAMSLDGPWDHPWLFRFWSFLGWIG